MSGTVKVGYASSKNINFTGTVDTGYDRETWDDMDDKEKDEVFNDLVWDLVEIYELD